MPKHDRPKYERLDLFLPPDLLAAVQGMAGKEGQSVTAWACATLAKAAGVKYTPPKVGRPPNPSPARKPAAKGRKGK